MVTRGKTTGPKQTSSEGVRAGQVVPCSTLPSHFRMVPSLDQAHPGEVPGINLTEGRVQRAEGRGQSFLWGSSACTAELGLAGVIWGTAYSDSTYGILFSQHGILSKTTLSGPLQQGMFFSGSSCSMHRVSS